ncbi:hypothetical protein [Nocardioides sp. URHA0020]|uniref:hypothetical protein n=1 Tax=Nocardioides sp. URHA0020 TaxID=1380392 RepID=UPI00048DEC59|nr:hypothetical protein [Nocardioides sp. URHA0020]
MTDPLAVFLACSDLDDLTAAYDALPDSPDVSSRAVDVVQAWTDVQAVANLLLHASVLPPDVRSQAVLRGLREPGYLQVAAAVGAGQLDPAHLDDGVRRTVLDALLDVVASDAGPAGVRASAELGPYLHADELELLDDLAAHPLDAVRHNLTQARLMVTDPSQQRSVLLPYLPDLADTGSAQTSP